MQRHSIEPRVIDHMLASRTFIPPHSVEDCCLHSIGASIVHNQEWNSNRNADVA
jgi:hypothetical protein